MSGIVKLTVVAVLALMAGALIGRAFLVPPRPSFTVELERMREDLRLEHERGVTTTYHVCPEQDGTFSIPGITNRPPKLFMVFPATLRYKLPLDDESMTVSATASEYLVRLGAVQADDPFMDSGGVQAIVTAYRAGTAESRYQNREISRGTALNRYLTLQQLEADLETIRERLAGELEVALRVLLHAVDDTGRRVRIEWRDDVQAEYLANAFQALEVQPPFGIRGCDEEDRPGGLVVNGIAWALF